MISGKLEQPGIKRSVTMWLTSVTNTAVSCTFTWTKTHLRETSMWNVPAFLQQWPLSTHYMADTLQVYMSGLFSFILNLLPGRCYEVLSISFLCFIQKYYHTYKINFIFVKISLVVFHHIYWKKNKNRSKTWQNKFFFSIRLIFAIFSHHCNLNTILQWNV